MSKSPDYIDSYTFRRMLEETAISDRELADEVGVSHAAVYRWRQGESKPSLAHAEKLVAYIKGQASEQVDRARQVESDIDDYKRIAGVGAEENGRPRVAS